MDYHTLTESDFFRFVSQNTEAADIRAAYDEFSQTIFRSYVEAGNPHRLLFALIYAEVELQSLHDTLSDGKDGAAAYLKKALALVRRMLETCKPKCRHYPPHKNQTFNLRLSVGRAALSS